MTTHNLPLTETITPADQAEVADAVRDAYRAGTPVYPIGGGTSLDYGARPTEPGVGLSLAKLNRVIDHAAQDMTITLEAGVTMAELAERLAAERQRLPIDVQLVRLATVGGVVATNSSGPRRYAHGTIRDYLIGVSAVDGRGTAFSGGGRVVKNAAGYNLCRLMAGSLGTLGVITQVTLMVRPMPETSALVICEVPDFDSAERLLARLVHTQTLPVAVELLAGPAWQEGPVMGPMLESSTARLLVGFEGGEAEVEWMVGQLRNEWRDLGVASPLIVLAAELGLMWDWLTGFSAGLQINVLPGATVGLIETLLRLDPGASIQAHAGNGVILVQLSSSEMPPTISSAVANAGGKMVVLSCPDGAAVIRAIKDRFDPKGVLNRGRTA